MNPSDSNNNNNDAKQQQPPPLAGRGPETTASGGGGGGGVNAFEWLAGGLFFGSSHNNNPEHKNKRELQNIESSKDVRQLWNGVEENFRQLMLVQQEEAAAAAAATSQQQQQTPTSDDPTPMDTTAETPAPPAATATSTTTTATTTTTAAALTTSDFLSARLIRLRFLLYEERKLTSSNNFRLNPTPNVAVQTVQFLVASQQQQQQQPQQQSTAQQSSSPVPLSSLIWLPESLQLLPFESRKVVTHIFCYLVVAGLDGHDAALYQASVMHAFLAQVVLPQFTTLATQWVTKGYDTSSSSNSSADIALHCGSMYRALLRHATFYQQLVGTTEAATALVFPFLDTLVHSPNFDVASDAMECLKLVLTASATAPASAQQQAQKGTSPQQQQLAQQQAQQQQLMAELAAEFMTRDYVALFDERFVPKLLFDTTAANNYMTKRGALQILSTLLLTRSNYNVMVRFVASARNLKVILLLLRHTSPHITLDAFHVFKVFVANPHKPPEVVQMLKTNQVKLCAYLQTLHPEKAQSDVQFRDERALIIATIEAL